MLLGANPFLVGSAVHGDTPDIPDEVSSILVDYCFDCHSEAGPEGDLSLESFPDLALDAKLELLNRIQEQLLLGRMPPEEAPQPGPIRQLMA